MKASEDVESDGFTMGSEERVWFGPVEEFES